MSEPAERVFCVTPGLLLESEQGARALLASLPATEAIDLALLVRMSNADVRTELVEFVKMLIAQARKMPAQAHELEAVLRAKGDKVRGPVRAKLSIPSKPWPR